MTLSAGNRLGSYEIDTLLGSGGMGEVYRARDTKLRRDVAVKVLREELASDPERLCRFEQEARAASALNHPNIITIYDIGQHGSTPYIAMEYVDGKTLQEMLANGPLPPKELSRLATQIAEGLGKAHSADILHRDLKPQNLMVTKDGYVKILDFGLAKLLTPSPESDSQAATLTKEGTSPGLVMGTAAYMSPEQALGKPLDARSDIFSLGAVLYEMATATKPFQGETLAALFNEILNKTPSVPADLEPILPDKLERIIRKALEKDPALRYQTTDALLRDLVQSHGRETPQRERSIIVLPFEDISSDRDNEYFSDGLTEEVIADLSQVPEIRVISRSSAMTLKGTKKTVQEISRELNVQFVLEGSVRKAGNNLRITVQLIDAPNDAHLWAQKYTGTLDDVFDIQEKVSRSIVGALELKLTPEADKKIAARPIENPHAYECYLRAWQEGMTYSEEGLERALQLIKNGMEIVGENELLYTAMGRVYVMYYNLGINPGQLDLYEQKTEEYANKALQLNPDSAGGHNLLGWVHDMKGNLRGTTREFKIAYRLDPNQPDVLFSLALWYAIIGKASAAQPLAKRLLAIDPLSAFNYCLPAWIRFFDGDLSGAIEPIRRAYEMDPESLLTRWAHAGALLWNRKIQEASPIVDSLEKDARQNIWAGSAVFLEAALRGDKDKALSVLTPEFVEPARLDLTIAWVVGQGFAQLGEKQKALDWLESAVSRGFINYPFISEYDPFLESLRQETRFKQLMVKVKYEWENFEV
jgi:serine/threonine protein kinase/tetratricopeptide (TPR) repeat protein